MHAYFRRSSLKGNFTSRGEEPPHAEVSMNEYHFWMDQAVIFDDFFIAI